MSPEPAVEVEQLLDHAESLLSTPLEGVGGMWPRIVPFLLRMALEQAVVRSWTGQREPLRHCTMRAQLICMQGLHNSDVGDRAAAAWGALSSACHYHSYELGATAGELKRWHGQVVSITRQLAYET